MYTLKAFVTHRLLARNEAGFVAVFGELSPTSLTYSREVGYHSVSAVPDLTLAVFSTLQETTRIDVTPGIAAHVLEIARRIYELGLGTTAQMFADQLLTTLTTQYQSSVRNMQVGPIVFDGVHYMPSWVAWDLFGAGITANRLKIWFADAAFAAQYDEFDIVVVPPVDNLNDLFRTSTQVGEALAARSFSQMVDKIQLAKGARPETIVRVDSYDYVDPLNAAKKLQTNWGVLVYGAAGNSVDSIKDALVKFILANSSHTRAEWTPLLPDIFKRTEFVVVPLWNQYAIPNRTVEAGIYSPMVNLAGALSKLTALVPEYPAVHVSAHAAVVSHPYKSLQLLTVGSPENRQALFKLTDVFGDYISVSSTSIDFNRQSLLTQRWSLLLAELLLAAESAEPFTPVPSGMTKTTRGGVLYVVKAYENIHYLVATKYSVGGA